MDLSCIISSGDLELYVLGMLSPEEAYQIEQLALLFPEVRAELDSISEVLEQTALASAAAAPPPQLKDRILESIRALNTTEAAAEPVVPAMAATPVADAPSGGRVIAFTPPPAKRNFSYGIAASLIGFVLCGAGLLYALKQNGAQKTQLVSMQEQLGRLNDSVGAQQRQIETYAAFTDYMRRPGYHSIPLKAMPGMPEDAMAQVFWNPASQDVMVANLSLPDAPTGKQYQLWALIDGQPVDAGMLSGTRMKPEAMKAFAKADAFAITLEKSGGSPTPTMSALYVMGKTI